MSFDQHVNFAYSTIQSGSGVIGSNSATSLVIASSGDLPNPASGQYNITVWPASTNPTAANAEIMRVTAKSGTTVTVTRAQEGTTALSGIASGYQAALTVTSKLLTDIESQLGPALLYDFTITGSDQAAIDTNVDGAMAGALSTAYKILEIWVLARTADTNTHSNSNIVLNNDTSSIYERQYAVGIGSGASAGTDVAAAHWNIETHGTAGSTGYPSVARLTIPGYASTTFWKVAEVVNSVSDGSTTQVAGVFALGYRSTSAVTRVKIAGTNGNLKVGSRLMIYAR